MERIKRRRHMRFPGFKLRALTFSYDDGVKQDRRLIEIMQKNGIKGTFNINSGRYAEVSGCSGNRLTLDECKDLYLNSGMEVAVHGYKHSKILEYDSAMQVYEILKDRELLEKEFGGIIKGMAYAYGDYDSNIVEILKSCGIKYARTTVSTENLNVPIDWLRLPATCHHKNEKLFNLLEEFLKPDDEKHIARNPRLFYLWGHSYEFDNDNNWERIEEFCEKVGNRDDVWYATNMEIYDYVKAYDSLEYSVDGKTVHNPSGIDVYVDYYGFNVIKPGETIKFD